MQYRIVGESFETSVSWEKAQDLCEGVKLKAQQIHKEQGLPGHPFISCRVTQLYRTGVCIYFYYAIYAEGLKDASQLYSRLEHALRSEVLSRGGALSHHHGVGKIRQSFLPQVLSPYESELKDTVKQVVDPHNVFGSNNQLLGKRLQ